MTNLKFTSVCRWAFPHVQGGIPMYNYHLLNTLYKKFDFKIVSHQNSTNMNFYANMGIQFVGYNNFHNDLYNQLTRLKILNNILRSWSDWNNSFEIMRTIDNNISGLIEFMDIHSEGYLYLKKFSKENRKARVIIRSHTPWALLRKYYPKDIIKYVDSWWAVEREKYCFHNCDAITVPSNDLKKQLVNTFDITGDKIKVLPNLVDTDHFKPIDRDSNDLFTILHVGRFEEAKGAKTLLEAFALLAKKYKNVHLINCGPLDKSFLKKCKNLLMRKKLLDRVTFEGFISYKALPIKYADADLIIVPPEIYESFSYTVAQGMACGKAVIASKIGGIPETLNNGNAGLLFTPGHEIDLFEKMDTLYIDEKKRIDIGKKARDYIKDNFSINVLRPKYLDYYQSLIQKRI